MLPNNTELVPSFHTDRREYDHNAEVQQRVYQRPDCCSDLVNKGGLEWILGGHRGPAALGINIMLDMPNAIEVLLDPPFPKNTTTALDHHLDRDTDE